jgi:hypothetical protein
MVVFQKSRVLGEQRTFRRIFDVALQRHQAFLARLVEKVKHHLQQVEVTLFVELRPGEHPDYTADNLLQDVKRIRDQHRPDGGSANNKELSRLHENL